VTLSEQEKLKNLRTLLEQHWLQCRHLESERASFMNVYGAITGAILAFVAYTGFQTGSLRGELPLYFLIGFALFWLRPNLQVGLCL
jgi:hypothetical protein